MQNSKNTVDYLDEDPIIQNQTWVCISFMSPETIKNTSLRAVKVRGVYATQEEAKNRAKELQELDPAFNIYVGEVGKWLDWDPDPNTIQDQNYREKELQKLFEERKKSELKAQKLERERKQEMLESNLMRDAEKKKKNKKNANQNPTPPTNYKEIETKVSETRTTVKNLKQEIDTLDNQEKEIDDKLNMLQKMYMTK